MSKILKVYVTAGIKIVLEEYDSPTEVNGKYGVVIDAKESAETLKCVSYNEFEDAYHSFNSHVKRLDNLMWEEDTDATEEYRKC